jgi:hypothetical protein
MPRRWTRALPVVTTLVAVAALSGCGGDRVDGDELGTLFSRPAEAALPELSQAEWKELAYEPVGCESRESWIAYGTDGSLWDEATVDVHAGDLTGDGRPEAVIQLVCPHRASSPPQTLVVFDVSEGDPDLLAVLDDELHFVSATVAIDDERLTVDGRTRSDDEPNCCPSHWGRVTYEWAHGGFVPTEVVEVLGTSGISAEPLEDGRHVGIIRAVTEDDVYVDLLDWIDDADEVREACLDDGLELGGAGGWCTEYYGRNPSDEVVQVPTADGAGASYWADDLGRTVTVDAIADLAGSGAVSTRSDSYTYFEFRVRDGEVTGMQRVS